MTTPLNNQPRLAEPIRQVRGWRKGEEITAAHLNETAAAVNRMVPGVRPPQQVMPKGAGDIIVCRLALTDVDAKRAGIAEVDGAVPDPGDKILVQQDEDTDGIYVVQKGGGNWKRVWRLSLLHGDDGAPVLKRGQLVSVWDGDSFPQVFLVGIDEVEEV